jgi:hypothetical protein
VCTYSLTDCAKQMKEAYSDPRASATTTVGCTSVEPLRWRSMASFNASCLQQLIRTNSNTGLKERACQRGITMLTTCSLWACMHQQGCWHAEPGTQHTTEWCMLVCSAATAMNTAAQTRYTARFMSHERHFLRSRSVLTGCVAFLCHQR